MEDLFEGVVDLSEPSVPRSHGGYEMRERGKDVPAPLVMEELERKPT